MPRKKSTKTKKGAARSSVLVLELPLGALKTAKRSRGKAAKKSTVKARVHVRSHTRKAPRRKSKR